MARCANRKSDRAQTSGSVGSNPTRAIEICVGRVLGDQAVCKTAALVAPWVRFPPGALLEEGSLVYTRRGRRSLKPERGVRLPCEPAGDVAQLGRGSGLRSRPVWVRLPPSPFTTEYANRQSGQVESLMFVGSTPTSVMAIFRRRPTLLAKLNRLSTRLLTGQLWVRVPPPACLWSPFAERRATIQTRCSSAR